MIIAACEHTHVFLPAKHPCLVRPRYRWECLCTCGAHRSALGAESLRRQMTTNAGSNRGRGTHARSWDRFLSAAPFSFFAAYSSIDCHGGADEGNLSLEDCASNVRQAAHSNSQRHTHLGVVVGDPGAVKGVAKRRNVRQHPDLGPVSERVVVPRDLPTERRTGVRNVMQLFSIDKSRKASTCTCCSSVAFDRPNEHTFTCTL
jgi:hypothetical protein